jgi:predicted RecB family nuclease
MHSTDERPRAAAKSDGLGITTDLHELLLAPGVGPGVIRRLEEAGVRSVADLVRRGVEPTVQTICVGMGHRAWNNRQNALVRALVQALCRSSGTD